MKLNLRCEGLPNWHPGLQNRKILQNIKMHSHRPKSEQKDRDLHPETRKAITCQPTLEYAGSFTIQSSSFSVFGWKNPSCALRISIACEEPVDLRSGKRSRLARVEERLGRWWCRKEGSEFASRATIDLLTSEGKRHLARNSYSRFRYLVEGILC